MERIKGDQNAHLKKKILELEKLVRELKAREKDLLKQESVFKDIFDTVREGITYTTLGGKVISVNRSLEQMLESRKEELIGRNILTLAREMLHPEDVDLVIPLFRSIISGKDIEPFQVRYKCKILDVSACINPKTRMLTGIVRDATEHKHTEEQLLKKNKDLSRLFNMSLHLLESLDRKEVLLKIVENAANLVGTDTSAIYFLKGNDLFLEATFPPLPAEYPEEFRYAKLDNHPYIKAVIEFRTTIIVNDVSKATLTEEERLITKIRNLGSLVYIPLLVQKKVEGVIILGTIGRKHEFEPEEIDLFSTFSNITSLALENSYLFENLRIALEKAEESNQLKTAFLHNISHEIRTPLNAIMGFSGILGQEGISPKSKKDYMNIISQSNNQLLSIIDDILNISQIEAKQVIINETAADLSIILNNLYRQYLPLAAKKKLGFSVNNSFPGHIGSVRIDENKVIGILTNLLNNAFRFTNSGSIEMGCTLQDDWIEFYVSDTGIGIPENEHARIFDRFYQIDKSDMGTYGGMGLGLSISAAYVDMLGEHFLLDSVPGKGSRFAFRLPLRGQQVATMVKKQLK